MSDKHITLAVLDTAGTTVSDGGLVVRAFDAAATSACAATRPHRTRTRSTIA